MEPSFVVYRRDYPGGGTIMVSVERVSPELLCGELRLDRRRDPSRTSTGMPPLLALVHGQSHDDVLRSLQALAEDDEEINALLVKWMKERAAAAAASSGDHPGRRGSAPPPTP